MKKVVLFIFSIIVSILGLQAQTQEAYKLAFQDSVRVTLENNDKMSSESSAVGAAFATAWHTLTSEQQDLIKKQAKIFTKKRYKPFPLLIDYYGSIGFAVTREKADIVELTSFLKVAKLVIENENQGSTAAFFKYTRVFFEYHTLHDEPAYRLLPSEDKYTFDYIKDVSTELPDSAKATDNFNQWDKNKETQDNNTVWKDDTTQVAEEAIPSWMQPMPQPVLSGPILKFESVTFNFITSYDSVALRNTSGTLSLRDGTFVGEHGSFDWSPAGLNPDSVHFEFKEYNFDVDKPNVKAEQGKLVYVGKFQGKVDGIFEFKSVRHKDKASSNYPRFMSFKSNIRVTGFSNETMKYIGGFALNGRKIYSSSVSNDYSRIEVVGTDDRKFTARSRLFEFEDSVVSAKQAMIQMYQENDSIFHPGIQFRYHFGKQLLSLQRSKSQLRDAPYSSSFFNVDFSADLVRWNLKSDSMNITALGGGNQAPMVIESIDFYNPEDYRILGGQGFNFHPLALVVNYAEKNGVREFYDYDLSQKLRLKPESVRAAMTFLSQKGMINYNAALGLVQVKDKAMHFFDAKKGEVDYDNLKIHSITDKVANATVNFPKRRMTVRGVEEVNVSDSLNVILKPDSSTITILQNRDIKFDGKITAGNFEINGKDFTFKYDSFFINLNKIDSIRFYVTEKNAKGQTTRRRVNNAMVGADSTASAEAGLQTASNKSQGTLFINFPDNKSGKIKVSTYPRLDATAGGVIYFDRSEVLDGAYDRSVFFVVPPFKLDSLNDADPGSINFEGSFVSSGMFPSFKEKLHTMPDKSLGFTHGIPPSGYQLYKGDGKVYGGINLDNEGLRVAGKIDYLAATVESNDFVFYPDSVVGRGKVGEIKEKQFGQVWFPQVTLPEFELNWKPKQDKFTIRNLKDPFNLYNTTAQLDGSMTASKSGVTGSGRLITRGSEAKSDELSFSAKDFSARHASFQVKTTNPEKPALAGEDIRLKFNLAQNFAEISPEVEGVAAIDFPYAQFKTSIPKARWDLNTQKITMTKDAATPIENSYFYTTRKELDSLAFNATKAEYDIKTQQMKVSGIPYIIVADAKITPENNEVLILENAKINQLKNTTIILDTLNGYHRLTDGVVDIISRKEFKGYATYQYVNSISDTFAIKMTDFHLEPLAEEAKSKRGKNSAQQLHTVAHGAVDAKTNLVLAPRIFYKGDMVMYASKPALQLKGFAKLDLKKIKNYNTWLKYEQSGDEKDVYLDFDKAETENGRKAEAGLHYAADNSLYITFITEKKTPDDEDFFLPSGSLYFDKESGQFKIEDRQKAAGEKLSGKVFNYNEEKSEVHFEGPVNFFKGFKDFTVTASGIGSGNLETNDIKMNSFMMVDMNLPIQSYQMMAADLQDIIKNETVEEGLGDQTELLYKIADIVGERVVKDYEERSLQGYVSLGTIPALAKPIVLSHVNLKWSQKYKAFYSQGLLGMSNIQKFDVNGSFEGFLEIRKNEDGSPVFHLFLKASPESWYYFGYEDNRLMVQAHSPIFNDLIAKKTNASKAKAGELVFIPGSDEETLAFINRFRKNYLGLESPYELGAATAEKKKEKKKGEKSEDDGF
ncbi:MAG: hypothetical protein HOP08_10890 [Cyclobacteriaceae bacterium]|nr:hypothetical protein [Cyclobacteriaceae bacterium]